MIREVEGDILLSRADAIAHGVAPFDHFASGLALALRERFPGMARDFRHYCQEAAPKPGAAWIWGGADRDGGSARIVNLLTQEPSKVTGGLPGKATLANVNHALKALARIAAEEKLTSIALPRLATGVGGLQWSDVAPLIATHLGGLGIPVIVYTTYRKGLHADEQLA
ncbi:MAG: macro domain-containing protein [Alphaproteobacteria bacterium]|nr:macro domain-containing protein [Alphaproteobacteria bacterium]